MTLKKGLSLPHQRNIVSTAKADKISETPLMKQYNQIKAKHPDALLLFRVGDFYETFGDDAVKAAGILGIILSQLLILWLFAFLMVLELFLKLLKRPSLLPTDAIF